MKQKYALQRQQNLARQQQQHAEAQGRVAVHMAVALCAAATERAAAAEHAAPASVAVQLATKQNARLYPWLVEADYRARVVVEAVRGFLPLVKPEHQRTTPPTDTDTTSTPPSLRLHRPQQPAVTSNLATDQVLTLLSVAGDAFFVCEELGLQAKRALRP